MDLSGDELAGVVELFGALTRTELERALAELAYRRGESAEPDAIDESIEEAIETYALVRIDLDGADAPRFVAGPVAFPELPDEAADLPHIMDVERRSIDRAAAAAAALERLESDVASVVAEDDERRAARLREVTYDLEAWGPVTADDLRERLESVT